MPLTMALTAMLPKGPALNVAGGWLESGPVMDGVESGMDAPGAAGVAAAGGAATGGGSGVWAQMAGTTESRLTTMSCFADIAR